MITFPIIELELHYYCQMNTPVLVFLLFEVVSHALFCFLTELKQMLITQIWI